MKKRTNYELAQAMYHTNQQQGIFQRVHFEAILKTVNDMRPHYMEWIPMTKKAQINFFVKAFEEMNRRF